MEVLKKILIMLTIPLFLVSCTNTKKNIYDPDVVVSEMDMLKDKLIEKYIDIENKFKIGILLPLSETNLKPIGESMLNMAQLALFDEDMENTVIMVYDTKGTTFGAKTAIEQAIKDGVDTIIGPLLSQETKAISKIAKNNDLVLFALSNDQELMNYENVFVTGYIPEQEIQLLLTYAINNNLTNFVAMLPSNKNGALINGIIRKAIKDKDVNLIKTEFYLPDDKSFNQKMYNLINSYKLPDRVYEEFEQQKLDNELRGGKPTDIQFVAKEEDKIYPQVLLIAEGGARAAKIAQLMFQYRNQDRSVILMGTSKLDGDNTILNNPYMENTVFVGSDIEKYDELASKYLTLYGTPTIKMSSVMHDLMKVVKEVYKKNIHGDYEIDKGKLLNPNGFDGIDGRFRFLPNGLVERRFSIIQIQNKQKVLLESNQEFLNY